MPFGTFLPDFQRHEGLMMPKVLLALFVAPAASLLGSGVISVVIATYNQRIADSTLLTIFITVALVTLLIAWTVIWRMDTTLAASSPVRWDAIADRGTWVGIGKFVGLVLLQVLRSVPAAFLAVCVFMAPHARKWSDPNP